MKFNFKLKAVCSLIAILGICFGINSFPVARAAGDSAFVNSSCGARGGMSVSESDERRVMLRILNNKNPVQLRGFLFCCMRENNVAKLQRFLDLCADASYKREIVNMENEHGVPALICAFKCGLIDMVKCLLRNGADDCGTLLSVLLYDFPEASPKEDTSFQKRLREESDLVAAASPVRPYAADDEVFNSAEEPPTTRRKLSEPAPTEGAEEPPEKRRILGESLNAPDASGGSCWWRMRTTQQVNEARL